MSPASEGNRIPGAPPLESALRHQRGIAIAGLALVSIAAWAFVLSGSGTGMSIGAMSTWRFPPPMDGTAMAGAWTAAWWLLILAMWWVMMVAMMLPSAAPMILLVGQVSRRAASGGKAGLSTGWLAAGYCTTWFGFSLLAVGLQFALERAGLVHGMLMWSLDPWLSAALLAAAGLYQLTPLKHSCLTRCRSPVSFLVARRRNGIAGALELGVTHGLWCVACCAALMALLFVGGIMNIVWIAGLALIVLVEKLLPDPRRFSTAIGILCLAGAVWVIAATLAP
jgi:predicted metal-binding membrane protein